MPLPIKPETNRHGEQYLPAINGERFSHQSADQLFAQTLPATFWKPDTCHLVIGSDSGLLMSHVQQRGVPDGACYLFIEAAELLPTVSTLVSPAVLSAPAIRLCHAGNWIEAATPLGLETYILKRQVEIHLSLAAQREAGNLYAPLAQQVSAALETTSYSSRLSLSQKSLIEQVLKNVSENDLPIVRLQGSCAGKTALIIGAGPSLNHHIDWIKTHRQHFVLFAVSRLSGFLQEVGITPDIVVSIDHQPINFEISKQALLFPEQVALISANHVSPPLLSQWPGKRAFAGELLPWHSPLNTHNLDDKCGPTVANTALVIAGELGFERILLLGVDLCSPPGESTHVGGEDLEEQRRRTLTVETNDGSSAHTNMQMKLAAQHLSNQARRITHSQVINLAPLACRIEGIDHCPASQLTLPEQTGPDFDTLFPSADADNRRRHNQALLDELQTTAKQLKTIQRLCDDAIKHNKLTYKKNKQGDYNLKAKAKVDAIQQRLDDEFSHLAIIIKKVGMAFFIDAMTTRDIHAFNDKQLERQGYLYYRAYRSSTALLDAMIADSLQRVRSRLQEDTEGVQLAMLAQQWQQDNQPGRAAIWRHHHPGAVAQLPADQAQLLEELEQDYTRQLSPPPLIGPLPDHYWYVNRKIDTYFATGNQALLERELAAMAAEKKPPPANHRSSALAAACLAYLRGDRQQALAQLQLTGRADCSEGFLHTLFDRAAAQGDVETAEYAAARLVEMSDEHLPKYANVLKINNKVSESADAYTTYLQRYPEDIDTWLALAQLYRELGENELAGTVYDYVLQCEPDNSVAAAFMKS